MVIILYLFLHSSNKTVELKEYQVVKAIQETQKIEEKG